MTLMYEEKSMKHKVFKDLNSCHENIKLTLEINPNKFLDNEIIRTNPGTQTQVYNKAKKLPVHWSSKIPYKYKRNAITGELHRARRTVSNFDDEIKRIRNTKTQDIRNMLLKTLSRILIEKKMSF